MPVAISEKNIQRELLREIAEFFTVGRTDKFSKLRPQSCLFLLGRNYFKQSLSLFLTLIIGKNLGTQSRRDFS